MKFILSRQMRELCSLSGRKCPYQLPFTLWSVGITDGPRSTRAFMAINDLVGFILSRYELLLINADDTWQPSIG